MVTFAQLKDMDTSKLAAAASNAGDLSGAMSTRGSQVNSKADIPPEMWQGSDASSASGLMQPLDSPLYDVSDSASRGQAVLEDLVEKLEGAKEDLNDAVSQAKAHGFTVGHDGTITIPESNSMAKAEMDAEMASQLRDQIQRALQDANDADDEASGSLGGEASNLASVGGKAGMGKVGGSASLGKSASDKGADGLQWAAKQYNDVVTGASGMTEFAKEFAYDPQKRASAKSLSTKLTVVGAGITGALAAVDQAQHDANNNDLNGLQRTGRAVARGLAEGGGALGGAVTGAFAGAKTFGWLGGKIGALGGEKGIAIGAGIGASAGSFIGSVTGGAGGQKAGEAWADSWLGPVNK